MGHGLMYVIFYLTVAVITLLETIVNVIRLMIDQFITIKRIFPEIFMLLDFHHL